MKRMILLLAFCIASVTHSHADEPASITGMWDDGLVGENTMISLSTNGTGDVISLACFEVRWTINATTKLISMTYVRQSDQKQETLRLTYDPKSDTLIGRLYGTNDVEHVLRRATKDKANWWAEIKKKAAKTSDGIRQPADGLPKPSM